MSDRGRRMLRIWAVLPAAFAGLWLLTAAAGGPRGCLEGPMESVISTLKDPRYAKGTPALKEEQQRKIREIIQGLFDFDEVSARTVGKQWNEFTPAQKSAFTEAFSDLLVRTYVRRIQSTFHDEKVGFLSDEQMPSGRAVVHTKIIREGGDVPVNYSLQAQGGSWRIYDIHVEGVSLVQNYRSQFAQLLLKESKDQLIERIRKRNREDSKQ